MEFSSVDRDRGIENASKQKKIGSKNFRAGEDTSICMKGNLGEI